MRTHKLKIRNNLHNGLTLDDAIKKDIQSGIRPVVMTAIMTAVGLLAAAISTVVGTVKKLTVVNIGGLIRATF